MTSITTRAVQSTRPVLVYGAYGHTGRFVLAELRRRGWRSIVSGRNHDQLAAVAAADDVLRPAGLSDAAALDRAADGCRAILNCAGPFANTAAPLIETALRAKIPYLDIAGETDVVADVFRRFDAAGDAL